MARDSHGYQNRQENGFGVGMVARSDSQTQFIAEYRFKFPHPWNRPITTVAAGHLTLDVRVNGGNFDAEYVGAFDGTDLVAVMNTWGPEGPLPYRHIGKTIVAPAYQGHGITRQIIEWWVTSRNECLASDENQTHDGARVWESMIMRAPRLRFYLWHPDGTEIELIVDEGRIVPDPWSDPHTRLLARPR
ncbi:MULTISPECIES: hypothetical protein [Sphingomonas]|jgi:GNAT superfamily N-acetyltransferase|nr:MULTISPECIES: hypothetical protein [Sphingomonas]